MNNRALIRTGTAGATVAAICCATPVFERKGVRLPDGADG